MIPPRTKTLARIGLAACVTACSEDPVSPIQAERRYLLSHVNGVEMASSSRACPGTVGGSLVFEARSLDGNRSVLVTHSLKYEPITHSPRPTEFVDTLQFQVTGSRVSFRLDGQQVSAVVTDNGEEIHVTTRGCFVGDPDAIREIANELRYRLADE
jgi:hypothetical protein